MKNAHAAVIVALIILIVPWIIYFDIKKDGKLKVYFKERIVCTSENSHPAP